MRKISLWESNEAEQIRWNSSLFSFGKNIDKYITSPPNDFFIYALIRSVVWWNIRLKFIHRQQQHVYCGIDVVSPNYSEANNRFKPCLVPCFGSQFIYTLWLTKFEIGRHWSLWNPINNDKLIKYIVIGRRTMTEEEKDVWKSKHVTLCVCVYERIGESANLITSTECSTQNERLRSPPPTHSLFNSIDSDSIRQMN